MAIEKIDEAWWGSFEIDSGVIRRCNVGPLVTWFERLANGVIIAWEYLPKAPDEAYPPPAVISANPSAPLLDREDVERFALQDSEARLDLMPSLADRPVITSPRRPLFILPRTEVTIFASSPLWLTAQLAAHSVFDRAVDQPSDTWFGPTTVRGESCYATKAFCRLQLADIQTPPHRAITAITVNNRADTEIHVERMKLPAPNLALYAEAGGRIWTEDVTFERTDEDEGFASLKIAHRAPRYAASPTRIREPREDLAADAVTRAFGSILAWSSA